MSKVKQASGCVVGVIVIALAFVGWNSIYTVNEKEQVIITQFGKPVGEPVTEAGLKFKTPFIQVVNRFEKRVLEWDGRAVEMPTKDKTYIAVDTFARWQIVDSLKYFNRLRDERSAQSRLDDILGSETRNTIAKHELIEAIRTTKDRKPEQAEELAEADQSENCFRFEAAGRFWNLKFSRKVARNFASSGSSYSTCALSEFITMRPFKSAFSNG